ncbi:ribosome maturation factor RimM [Actinopolyspora erythraea]|uniref:Ribosome maturation factor RimM n=1 Tax=Actinopolyspora erythraea TaxID=414996 RepID=A0A099D6L4_9ACTN|nr:ribosome maturation factor RimM [Actinopolyspora erythraea]ASU78123.1 ribosome maturation factor RimM [Actinopolyspora erythraea]KGI81664.1 16S rRNA processing protein RimM [Actinopolyspora erythraea]
MAEQQTSPLVVGRVVKPHGVHGELVVEVRTDSPDRRFVAGAVLGVLWKSPGTRPESLELTAVRRHAGRLLVKATEVRGREEAERLRGALLTVRSDELEGIEDPDEFHDHELEGLRAFDSSGNELGTLLGVLHAPGGELLRLSLPDGREALVPFVADIVVEVSPEDGFVTVDPPEGLLDLP